MTKENDIKVSVLMLSYNQEAYIEDAMEWMLVGVDAIKG